MIYATRGLVESMLRFAREREPESVTVSLSVTRAGDLPKTGLDDDVPVFTHFYMPAAGGSVNAVFGMDMGTPVGQTQGRFVSHPQGDLGISKTDDLAEVVFVAVPPWDLDTVATFDRSGRRVELELLDVDPPQASL